MHGNSNIKFISNHKLQTVVQNINMVIQVISRQLATVMLKDWNVVKKRQPSFDWITDLVFDLEKSVIISLMKEEFITNYQLNDVWYNRQSISYWKVPTLLEESSGKKGTRPTFHDFTLPGELMMSLK